ncbi:MAG: hypothetical protein AAF467_25455 [Actinomycetota bacterium]
MTEVAQWFPYLVVLAFLVMVYAAYRLSKRVSRGARTAGPREIEQPDPPGQAPFPWELSVIDDHIRYAGQSGGPSGRYDVSAMVNRLSSVAGVDDPRYRLTERATEAQVEAAISRIEQQLGLPPLVDDQGRPSRTQPWT